MYHHVHHPLHDRDESRQAETEDTGRYIRASQGLDFPTPLGEQAANGPSTPVTEPTYLT